MAREHRRIALVFSVLAICSLALAPDTRAQIRYGSGARGISVAFFPDGTRLVETYADGTVRIVSVADGEEIDRFKASEKGVTDVSVTARAGGNTVAVAVSPDWKWFALLPDRGSTLTERTEMADIQTAQEDCEWEEPRDPLCVGLACEDAQMLFRDGCVTLTNASARRISIVARFSCGSSSSRYLAAGESAAISNMMSCVRSVNELMGIDIEFAEDGR